MIDPAVRIEDVDPVGFARLNAWLASRDRQPSKTVTILHDDGRVVQATAERIDDDVDEVVFLDRRGLDDLSARLVEAARATDDQGLLLSACHEIYRSHWAVTIVPEPAPSPWPAVQRMLDTVPDGAWLMGKIEAFTLAAEVRGGRIVRITSHPPTDAHVALKLEVTWPD